jgi:hypothetical protein
MAQKETAQKQPAGRRALETAVSVPNLSVLRVGPGGRPSHTPPDPRDDCNVIASLTDANFNGGSFVAQAGFAQTEMAAATYTVAASEFPIKINLAEAILVTSNASVQTVTHWSMLFYSGTPTNGQLIATYSSDDEILSHARVGPGTAGVNIQFSIDPSDPEQLIITDNGSHTFTFAFRIDQHNQQTGNPCFTAPPTCCNAFPCTDVSGLQFPSANWLFGVNCGPFGCPPNGGWSTFANLASACRPSGDWVMRATWSGVNCGPGVGACCMPDTTCQATSSSACATAGGVYRGDGTSCATANCPTTGACCSGTGGCVVTTPATCSSLGGTFLGAGVACSGNQCPSGACCLASGSCVITQNSAACTSQGGIFRGPNTVCATANCPQPTGACCTQSGCAALTQADCTAFGGVWHGPGSICPSACQTCYPNCDGSTQQPVLNVNDFVCFQSRFAAADPWADCDHSNALNVNDFVCFQQQFAAGCP